MKISLSVFYCSLAVITIMASCKPYDPDTNVPPKQTDGWIPVYAKSVTDIQSKDAVSIENGGKIYIKDKRLYQVESGKGIHVIDISNPEEPKNIKFIQIIGCQEISIQGNSLYANNVNDLVTINIADINNVVETNRTKDAFHILNVNHPPSRGWFECIDPSKGEVIGWETKTLYSPKCLY